MPPMKNIHNAISDAFTRMRGEGVETDYIIDVTSTIESLEPLTVVKIEGLETIIVKYRNIVEGIRKKSYGILVKKTIFENFNSYLIFPRYLGST